MSFLAPVALLGLLILPVLVGFYLWAQRRRGQYAVRFTNLDLLANLVPKRPSWRRHLPPLIYLLAVAGLVFALARPTMALPTPREDATIVLAMDVSGSMNAVDVSPSRLDAARDAARGFLDQLPPGIRVGLVTFSSTPITLVEPTADRERVRKSLDQLVAVGGTAMGDAIDRLVQLAAEVRNEGQEGASEPSPSPTQSASPGTEREPSLVAGILLSDGANSVGNAEPLDAASRAAAIGVPIYTIALGTPDGQVEVEDPFGRSVILDVPPDTETLAQIAELTGGIAFDAPTAEELRAVYDNLQSRIGFVEITQEVTFAFAAGALVLVVVGAGLAALWFGRLP
jgi:Ca-activated chloride channel family protein